MKTRSRPSWRSRVVVATVALSVAGWGCREDASSGGGFGSPEAVGQALVAALATRSPDAARRLFPNDAELTRAFGCPDAEPHAIATAARRRLAREVREAGDGVAFAWKGLNADSVAREVFPQGHPMGPCTPTVEMTLQWCEMAFDVTQRGVTHAETMGVILIHLGRTGPWFLMSY